MGTRTISHVPVVSQNVQRVLSPAGGGVQKVRIDHGHAAKDDVDALTEGVREGQKVGEIDDPAVVQVEFDHWRTESVRKHQKVREIHLPAAVEVHGGGIRADDSVPFDPQSRKVVDAIRRCGRDRQDEDEYNNSAASGFPYLHGHSGTGWVIRLSRFCRIAILSKPV